MATSYIPVSCNTSHDDSYYTTYISPVVAAAAEQMLGELGFPNRTLGSFRTKVANSRHRRSQRKKYPVVIFSPALHASRIAYTEILTAVASQGFVVVSIDHPYDSMVVEFPTGRVIYAVDIEDSEVPLTLDVRVKDVIFTLDQMHSNSDFIPYTFRRYLNLNRVAAIGHSFGGATAAQVTQNDTRFAGGLNFDGNLYGPVVKTGLNKPFINFGAEAPSIGISAGASAGTV
ncbi:hypothetical protein EYZ11_005600 [Aspergillus tanneri]|uniref:1-alkyl-2-acetylglycerophosphocholine esterase n=1 Tax=Aspergillus tanneri TaxID=1220188 RepID=A0A4S3JJW9_9EURO|nr:hypothetical protein EYZ11_005600 [Aspergillus tanneri]